MKLFQNVAEGLLVALYKFVLIICYIVASIPNWILLGLLMTFTISLTIVHLIFFLPLRFLDKLFSLNLEKQFIDTTFGKFMNYPFPKNTKFLNSTILDKIDKLPLIFLDKLEE